MKAFAEKPQKKIGEEVKQPQEADEIVSRAHEVDMDSVDYESSNASSEQF